MQRAYEHVKDFDVRLDLFLRENPQRVAFNPNAPVSDKPMFVRPSIPSAIVCIVGDAVHNLRSALDHVAYAVAKHNQVPSNVLDKVSFTIRARACDFNNALTDGKVSCIGPAWLNFLRRVEPYHGGDGANLFVVSALDNLDKHRDLIVVEGLADTFIRDDAADRFIPVRQGLSFKDGIEIQLDPSEPNYHTHTRTRVVVRETIPGLDPDAWAHELLADLTSSVRKVILLAADPTLWP